MRSEPVGERRHPLNKMAVSLLLMKREERSNGGGVLQLLVEGSSVTWGEGRVKF